jgi:hypothetical protein
MTSAVQVTVETTSVDNAAIRPNARRHRGASPPRAGAAEAGTISAARGTVDPSRPRAWAIMLVLGIISARLAVAMAEWPQHSSRQSTFRRSIGNAVHFQTRCCLVIVKDRLSVAGVSRWAFVLGWPQLTYEAAYAMIRS